jgi:hypothetical protein
MDGVLKIAFSLLPGLVGAVVLYIGYVAVTKGLPAAKALLASWWNKAKNDVAAIKGDIAALEGRVGAVEQKVGIAPAKPAAPAASAAPAAPAS